MEVTDQLNTLRKRLQDTNSELHREKKKVEEVLADNMRLSAPFIEVTEDVALVPLFGELDENKVSVIKDTILESAYSCEINSLLIDFTAVGGIDFEGLAGLKNLFKSLQTLGKEVIITGIHPKQAQHLHHLDIHLNIRFVQSLQVAVRELFSKVTH